ncbi:alpha-1,2-fucosyltransferase [Mucilaginibacter angelicae]|uniref:Alpha-1,2-fucosyltransferase n=1 Tax=Mucilaginibacter angelicae TaxID=869718 RepID=A0ABV6L0W7_9SPHI
MIIIEIKKGLGNQLFQYAAGKSLAAFHRVPLKLDLSSFYRDKSRPYSLSFFEVEQFDTSLPVPSSQHYNFYHEPFAHFDEGFFKCPPYSYLSGFWQSEKYFAGIADVLRKEFRVKDQYVSHLTVKAAEIRNEESVCLHVRRGDYLQPGYEFLGVLSLKYYIRALDYLKSTLPGYKLYIFSDDIEWVKHTIKFDSPHEFISPSIQSSSIEDFYLMQQCRHHIIANSSFSWWTAWLSEKSDSQIIICPKIWFADRRLSSEDIASASWIRL